MAYLVPVPPKGADRGGGGRWLGAMMLSEGGVCALVNSNNLLCLLTPLSTTYSRLVFK